MKTPFRLKNIRKAAMLSTVAFLSLMTPVSGDMNIQNSFNDIATSYARVQINDLYSAGIVAGKSDHTYAPKDPVTRAEYVKILGSLMGMSPVSASVSAFGDVDKLAWYYGWVQAELMTGLVYGTSATTFEPNRPITRQEAAVLLGRAISVTRHNANAPASSVSTDVLPFNDRQDVKTWAVPYVKQVSDLKLMNGYMNTFRPDDLLTREEIAVIFDQLLNNRSILNQTTATAAASGSSTSADSTEIRLGWQYFESSEQFEKRVENSSFLDTLSPRWYFLEKDRSVSDYSDPSLVSWAHQRGKKVWALVGNHFDDVTTHTTLSDSGKRAALVNKLLGYAQKYQLDGLNIDFENMQPADRDSFTAFIGDLARALHAQNKTLSVDVPPDLGTDWSQPYDFTQLANGADYLILMGYGEHWESGAKAGSLSSLPWLQKSISGLTDKIPARKLIVGLPFYTFDWHAEGGQLRTQELTMPQTMDTIQNHQAQLAWDDNVGQYVANYTDNGVAHTIWVEDSRSISRKYQLVAKNNVAGTAFWYVGGESDDVWKGLDNLALLQGNK
ncbi:S-layer homology domain-containing protein [Aneurinibacillus terranovensis]|uniref:S-layer homology domain-containing protein n=1 Tax=Aneurinibacillus terranovensis TaxID=278991 RepID=UPI000412117C|nr:S-layer homology domain-containing protein [Aneurinibacillus terranovensis]